MEYKKSEKEGFVDKGNGVAKGCGAWHKYTMSQSAFIAGLVEKREKIGERRFKELMKTISGKSTRKSRRMGWDKN